MPIETPHSIVLIDAAEMPPERDAELFCFEVPARGLDPGLCHSMAAGPFHQVPDVGGRFDLFADDHRREDLFGRHPRRIGPFVGVTGRLRRR